MTVYLLTKPVAVCQTAHLPVRARQEVLFARTSLFRAKSSRGTDIAANTQMGSFSIAVISLRGIPARREEMKGLDVCAPTWGCCWKLNLGVIWDESRSILQIKWVSYSLRSICYLHLNTTKDTNKNPFYFRNVMHLRCSWNKLYDRLRHHCPERAAKHQILLQCNYPKIKILWAGRWTNLYSWHYAVHPCTA